MLGQFKGEPTAITGNLQCRARECRFDSFIKTVGVSDLSDRLKRGCHVPAIVIQGERASAQLVLAGRRVRVGPEMIVETPRTNLLAYREDFRSALGIGYLGEHAVEAREV